MTREEDDANAQVGPEAPDFGGNVVDEGVGVDAVPVAVEDEAADIGPGPPAPKRRKVLQHEVQYLAALPDALMYEKSYMHRDTVTHAAVTAGSEFFITASADGVVKFWKKMPAGIEFAKQYRAHLGPVTALAVSVDGSLAATASTDRSVKIFDVASFDLIAMLRLDFQPGPLSWVFKRGDPIARLAVADAEGGSVAVLHPRSEDGKEVKTRCTLHASPVVAMEYVAALGVVISTDAKGAIEYWDPDTGRAATNGVQFALKLETDLYAMARARTSALSLAASPDGRRFAVLGRDNRVRVFAFATGKLTRVYDESTAAAAELQRSGPQAFRLEPIDFGRRMAVEKEVSAGDWAGSLEPGGARPQVLFDASGHLLLVPSLLGVKVINLVSNAVVRVIGAAEGGERLLGLALFQGGTVRGRRLLASAAAADAGGAAAPGADPTLLATGAGQSRFFLFTRREPPEDGRDVYNERMPGAAIDESGPGGPGGDGVAAADLPRGAVIHTTRGDITVRLYPDECPRTVENFCTHARNGYYDGLLFHRVIKGFMLQTGDPRGDGTGGESIWGGEFEDEITRNLRHDRPFTLSMANAGPNTNGSQFFITTAATPWLDGKHTVFGRAVKGMDVVVAIEKVKTNPRTDKPLDDIRMVNIEPKANVE